MYFWSFHLTTEKVRSFLKKVAGLYSGTSTMGGSGFFVFGLLTGLDGTSLDCMCLDNGRVVTFVSA